MTLVAGYRIGPYTILSPLGSGGMGEVYSATDSRLNRTVAIKILPAERTQDDERRRRFLNEARAAGSLNHPNLVTVYDLVEFNGQYAIVMEHVAGRTLDRYIPSSGLPVKETLRLAIEVAAGLEAAHQTGIVHRDLKPSNVIVTETGSAKVLDFGLAKLVDTKNVGVDEATVKAGLTSAGAILGTLNYLSPEQAEGKGVDPRSDIFSFGTVLYEMISGKRAFEGDTAIATITAILRDEPKSLSDEISELPPEFERVVSRCLRKDPGRRFQTMADLRASLEDLRDDVDSGVRSVIGRPVVKRRPWPWIAACAAVVSLIVAAVFSWTQWGSPEPVVVRPLTSIPGSLTSPAFSPDGKLVAFSWGGPENDNFDIYAQYVDSDQQQRLTMNPSVELFPRWSRDGRRIFFSRPFGTGGVFERALLGGEERKVADGLMDDLSPDEKYLLQRTSGTYTLLQLPGGRVLDLGPLPEYGEKSRMLRGRFSPDGQWIYGAYTNLPNRTRLFRRRTENGTWMEVSLTGLPYFGSFCPSPNGREMLLVGGADSIAATRIYRAPAAGGSAVALPFGEGSDMVEWSTGNALAYVVNRNGWHLYKAKMFPAANEKFQPEVWIPKQDQSSEGSVALSPDGLRIAATSHRDRGSQLWLFGVDGSGASRLTDFRAPVVGSPRWSPDGQLITFDARTKDFTSRDVWVVKPGSAPVRLTGDGSEDGIPEWSTDGGSIYFGSDRSGRMEIWRMKRDGSSPVQLTKEGGFHPRLSPDGKFLYYLQSRELGGLRRMPLEGGREEVLVQETRSRNYVVLKDGIYFLDQTRKPPIGTRGRVAEGMFFRFASGKYESLGYFTPRQVNPFGIVTAADGKTVYFSMLDDYGSSIMLAEHFR